jgi:tetratricopeptide (TPR) repeat protein
VPLDRDATLKQAEKLLRQGKLQGAVAEYVRLVEAHPRDWSAINALGDLYMRAGETGQAAAQFCKVADYLYGEGFLPKAAALYKKALKAKAGDEHTLARLGDIAIQQGLIADAKSYLGQLAEQRRARGDELGAAECLVRLGTLDEADSESKVAAAEAAVRVGDAAQAAAFLRDAAQAFEDQGRKAEALDAFLALSKLVPDDLDVLLASARLEVEHGRDAKPSLLRVLTLAPQRHHEVLPLCEGLAAAGMLDSAYQCVEVLTDIALLEGDWDQAIEGLQSLLRHGRHVPALIRIVEICVDAGRDGPMREAQASLADAYLETGHADEARVIAEDLLASEPGCEAHLQRLRRALEMLGVDDVDHAIAELTTAGFGEAFVFEEIEVDLSNAVEPPGGESESEPLVLDPSSSDTAAPDLEDVFAEMRNRVARGSHATGAHQQYQRGLDRLLAGDVDGAVADLQAVARTPMFRFAASAQLGRLHLERGDLRAGVDWLERAAEAPAPTPEEGFALLYELADALERLGESSRALAVLMELDADAGGYRDVRARVASLSRIQAGSPGA